MLSIQTELAELMQIFNERYPNSKITCERTGINFDNNYIDYYVKIEQLCGSGVNPKKNNLDGIYKEIYRKGCRINSELNNHEERAIKETLNYMKIFNKSWIEKLFIKWITRKEPRYTKTEWEALEEYQKDINNPDNNE